MKKIYQDPTIQLVIFEAQDILTLSSTTFVLGFKDRNTEIGNGDSDAWREI